MFAGRSPRWSTARSAIRAGFSARRTTAIEAAGTAFRFGAIGELADGSPAAPAEDAGEIDGEGRIAVLYTFPGPLRGV